jgi:hypothetical protein
VHVTYKCVPLALTLALLSSSALAQEAERPPAQVRLGKLLERWTESTGRRLLMSPRVRDLRVPHANTKSIARAGLVRLARHVDVLLIETKTSVEAVPARDAQQAFGRYEPVVVRGKGALPQGNVPVTLIYPLTQADGQSVFANLRGILCRDPMRLGNVLYLRGSNYLVITDLAPRVAYYRQIAEQLDRPRAKGQAFRLAVYEVPRATWNQISKLDAALAAGRLRQALGQGGVRALETARLEALDRDLKLNRRLREQGSSLSMTLRIHRVVPKNVNPKSVSRRVSIDVQRSAQGNEISRHVDLPLPSGPAVLGAALSEGEKPTHLVVIFYAEK